MYNKEATVKFHTVRAAYLLHKLETLGKEFCVHTSETMLNDLKTNGSFSENNRTKFDDYSGKNGNELTVKEICDMLNSMKGAKR